MFGTGHILNCLWPIAVDLDRLPATAKSATEIRLERVVIIIAPYFDFQVNRFRRNKTWHVMHPLSVVTSVLFARSLWCFARIGSIRNRNAAEWIGKRLWILSCHREAGSISVQSSPRHEAETPRAGATFLPKRFALY